MEQSEHQHPPGHEESKISELVLRLKRKADEYLEVPPVQILRTELAGQSAST